MTNKFILIIWIAFSYSFDMYAQVALDLECEDVLSFSTNGSSTFMTIKDSSGQLSHEWFMTDFGLIEYRVYGKNRKDSIYVLFGKRGEILEMRTDTSLFLYSVYDAKSVLVNEIYSANVDTMFTLFYVKGQDEFTDYRINGRMTDFFMFNEYSEPEFELHFGVKGKLNGVQKYYFENKVVYQDEYVEGEIVGESTAPENLFENLLYLKYEYD